MEKKNILVFGAAGFMGTYLIDALSKLNFDILASDISGIGEKYYKKKKIHYIHVDITKKEDFNKLPLKSYNTVIHLAATQPANVSEKNYDPKDYINVNVIGTLNILEFCRKNKIKKIIYASSHRNTQALWVNNIALKEIDGRGIKYDGDYAMFSISESAAQDCVLHYEAQYGLHGLIFRLPPVYGFGPHTEIFKDGKPIKTGFQIFIEKAKSCQPLEVWGDSSRGRDIVYIKDVISAFIKAINSETAKGLFNITSGKQLSLIEEVRTIAKVFWGDNTLPVIIERPEINNYIDTFVYDISKAKTELNWTPKYSFEDMLHDYIQEGNCNTFGFLIEKRKQMFDIENS
jgi:UDP-glucose 4-epimerase